MGNQWKQWETLISWAPKSLQLVNAAMKLRHLPLGRKTMTNLDRILKSSDITLPTKFHIVKAMVSPGVMYVWMWELEYKESWVLKTWCFWTVVLEKTLESPLDCKEFQPVHPKGDQSWVLIRKTNVEAETPVLWTPYKKSWLIWKDSDAGKDWGQEEKGWQRMRWLDGITDSMDMSWWWTGRPGVLQLIIFCKVPLPSCRESDKTERLHCNELNWTFYY